MTHTHLSGPADHPWRRSGRGSWLLCLLATTGALAASTIGCSADPSPAWSSATSAGASAEVAKEESVGDNCADLIQSIAGTFQFELLGLSSDIQNGVSLINQWVRACKNAGKDGKFPLEPEVREVYQRSIPPDQIALVERSLYKLSDGEHIRDCLMSKAVQEHAMGKGTSDLGRVVNIFNHIVRNVDLIESHPDGIPLSLYHVSLLGFGTTEDRAWLFANVLRQLKIDCVLLYPRESSQESGSGSRDGRPFLIGVLLDDQVYLFDPRAGLPVPALASSTKSDSKSGDPAAATGGVATLAQVRAQPEILKQLDIDAEHPYPIRGESLEKPVVAVVGNTSLWSPRMELLQGEFTGARAVIIYDSLADSDGRRGMLSRVSNFGNNSWEPNAVIVWSYPEQQLGAGESLNAQHKQTMLRLTDVWNGPLEVEPPSEKGGPQKPPALSRKQFRGRLAQIEGKYDDAIKNYTLVQIARTRIMQLLPPNHPVFQRFNTLHERGAEDATYFIGISKLEQGRPDEVRVAMDKFRQYQKQYKDGLWQNASRYMIALILANQGKFGPAAEILKSIPSDHPQQFGFQYLIRRWEAADKSTPPADAQNPPATGDSTAPKERP